MSRADVVREARSWVRTPYHSCADIKGAGVDCGMLLVRVYVDTGHVESFDPRPYPSDWYLHRSEEKYLEIVERFSHQIEKPDVGDIMVFRFGRCYGHGGIITSILPLTLVHAHRPAGMVLEEPLYRHPDLSDPGRNPRFYSIWSRGES